MASGVDHPGYSGPVKRRKLEEDAFGPSDELKIQPSEFRSSAGASAEDLEGENNGLSEMNNSNKPATGSSNSSNTSPTGSSSDDTGFPLDTADEKDEVSSTVSNLSDITGISMLSDDDDGSDEYNQASNWVRQQIHNGADPRNVLKHLLSETSEIPEEVDDITLWRIVINMMSEPPRRQKLSEINTIKDVVELIKKSKKIIVLTGAGVSVSCGIPDFRSRDGIYSRLAQDFPDLPDPQAMFDIGYFSQDPRPFFKFAREIYPGQFKPSPCHEFIKILEEQGKLLRNYSQNIDTLERVCGIKNVIECHGSFATASCTKCKYQVPSDDIRQDIFSQTIPMCPKCQEQSLPSLSEPSSNENFRDLVAQGVMKPDIVFFGEGLPDVFHEAMANDKDVCDLLIVMGSSLKVRPVALIPSSIPHEVPQILINRESLSHLEFDVELLGDGDVVINQLCHMLNGSFKKVCWSDTVLKEAQNLLPLQYPLNNSWENSQDALESQDLSQDTVQNFLESNLQKELENLNKNDEEKSNQEDNLEKNQNILSKNVPQNSSEMKNFPEFSRKRDRKLFDEADQNKTKIFQNRPSKKVKSDTNDKDTFEVEPNSSPNFYSHVNHYLEKQTDLMDVDVSKNASSDSDYESLSNISQQKKVLSTKEDHVEKTKGDRSEVKKIAKRKIEEVDECSQDNTLLENECMEIRSLSFHSKITEHTVKNYPFIEESRERKLTNSNYDNNMIERDIDNIPKTLDPYRGKSITLSSGTSPTTSNESSSRTTEEIYIPEDCHVVPRIDYLKDKSILDDNLILSNSDKIDLKPRHASIDSVMDSALGDSCSSSDCQKRKNDEENTDDSEELEKLESPLWQLRDRESLASRLPENSFYQIKPGKYIFPGAEVYTNFPWSESSFEIDGSRSALETNELCDH